MDEELFDYIEDIAWAYEGFVEDYYPKPEEEVSENWLLEEDKWLLE